MEKINFQNGITPLNDTNLNQLQTNMENALNNKQDKMIEGTWTPTINTLANVEPTIEYIYEPVGRYKKIGKLVYISFRLRGRITALKGANNYATISGLPFPSIASVGANAITIGTLYNLTNETSNMKLWASEQIIRIQCDYGVGAATLKTTPSNGYFDIAGSGWYETDE